MMASLVAVSRGSLVVILAVRRLKRTEAHSAVMQGTMATA